MRWVLVGAMLLAATPARAADGALEPTEPPTAGVTLPTGGSHEVVWTPPTLVPVRGPRFAPVTIDAFVALGHPPSYATAELARRWAEREPGVRVVLHLFAYGAAAETALEALLVAGDQGGFWPLFDKLVQSRQSFAAPANLQRLCIEAGLDAARMGPELAAHRRRADVERLLREGRSSGHHPPEILINGRRMSPWSGDETIGRAIAEARARAEELLADGVPLTQLYDRIVELDEEVPFVVDPLTRGTHKRLAVDVAGAPARGPASAPVTVVLWANFACMQCAEVAAALKRLDEAHPNLVRVVWKHFPSPYRAAIGETAAEYAAAAHAQGRFWPLYDVAMASHLIPARVTRLELDRLGQQAQLDAGRVRSDLENGRARAAVEHDAEEARRLGVPTAGSVAVNGIPVAGAPSYELLERLVAAELDAGLLERLRRR